MTIKNLFKVEYETYGYTEEFFNDVKFLGERLEDTPLINAIDELVIDFELKEYSVDTLLEFLESKHNNYKDIALEVANHYLYNYGYVYDSIEDEIEDTDIEGMDRDVFEWDLIMNYLYEFMQFESIAFNDYFHEDFLEYLGLQMGTVGYSQWSHFVTLKDMSINYITALWEGGLVSIEQIDEDGDMIDSMMMVYYENSDDLLETIKYYFDTVEGEEIVLVENEITEYFDVPKAREIPLHNYKYELIA